MGGSNRNYQRKIETYNDISHSTIDNKLLQLLNFKNLETYLESSTQCLSNSIREDASESKK